jgi:hypothetical protein
MVVRVTRDRDAGNARLVETPVEPGCLKQRSLSAHLLDGAVRAITDMSMSAVTVALAPIALVCSSEPQIREEEAAGNEVQNITDHASDPRRSRSRTRPARSVQGRQSSWSRRAERRPLTMVGETKERSVRSGDDPPLDISVHPGVPGAQTDNRETL